jgi:tetratricopeptide (TPR) repeat protein
VQNSDYRPPRHVKPQVSAALEAVCRKAMALRPADRYATPRALADEIERWLADEPVLAYPESLPARLGRWGRRHRTTVAATGVLLVSTVVALAVGIVAVNQERQLTATERDEKQHALNALEVEQQRTQAALVAEAQRRKQTRTALDAMSSQVIDEWLARQRDLLPEHKAFLNQALAFYEEFARDTGQDEEARAGVAAAFLRVGNIRQKLGQASDAEAAYRGSRELFQRLAADFSSVLSYRQDLAGCYNNLGNLLADTGRLKEAEAVYREALAVKKQLAAEFPNRPDIGKDLAGSYNNLGKLLADTRQPKEAETAFREALALLKQLTADFPTRADLRRLLAGSHGNLGVLLEATGDLQKAEAAFRDALKLLKRLATDFPSRPNVRQELAKSRNNLAILLANTGQDEAAAVEFREALTLHQQLTNQFPNVPDHQGSLANAMASLAVVLSRRKDFPLARQLLEQAQPHLQAALDANPHNPFYRKVFCTNRRLLAATLVHLGEHSAAAAAAAELARGAFEPASDTYGAACFLFRCVPLAEKDGKLSKPKRRELAKTYADQALETLRQAVARGYKNAAHLRQDPDLASLRSRPEFQQLVRDLEQAGKK